MTPGGIIPLWGARSSRNRGAASFRYEGRHHPGIGGRLPQESAVWLTHRSAWRLTTDEGMICAFSDAIGELMLKEGRILHGNIPPNHILGEHRQSSDHWEATKYNLKARKDSGTGFSDNKVRTHGADGSVWKPYRHKFLGGSNSFVASPHTLCRRGPL
jgi:hypothetical protein